MGYNTDLDPVNARDLGPLFVDNDADVAGMDGAYPIELSDTTLWFFGDTFIGDRDPTDPMPHGLTVEEYDDIGRLVTNSGLLCDDRTGADGCTEFEFIRNGTNEVRPLVPLKEGEHPDDRRIWCLDGWRECDQVYLYYLAVEMFEPENGPFPLGFALEGSGVAVGGVDHLKFTRATDAEGRELHWRKAPDDDPSPHFGCATMSPPDSDWLYVYGADSGDVFADRCYLARVPRSSAAEFGRYRYFSGSATRPTWSTDPSRASALFDGMPNEFSVTYNRHLDTFLAVYSLGLSGHIVGRTAPTPWGPWSAPAILWSVDPQHAAFPADEPVYAAKEHPELSSPDDRTIYVTYVEFSEYYPHLVEVTLD